LPSSLDAVLGLPQQEIGQAFARSTQTFRFTPLQALRTYDWRRDMLAKLVQPLFSNRKRGLVAGSVKQQPKFVR
jgi:hypothetical protein